MKLNISTTLASALVALLTPVVAGAGKLWDGTRDAYIAARVDFNPEDSAKAIRQTIADTLKANPKSVASYIQTCVWLEKNAEVTPEILAELSMGDATDLRYPKAPKPEDGEAYVEAAKAKVKAAADKREAAEREAAENATPRQALLSQIAKMLAPCDDATLSLIAAEIQTTLAALGETEQEVEQDEASNG